MYLYKVRIAQIYCVYLNSICSAYLSKPSVRVYFCVSYRHVHKIIYTYVYRVRIYSVYIVSVYIHLCMVYMYGVYVWCICMVYMYGVYVWCICMVYMYGVYVWCICMVYMYGVYSVHKYTINNILYACVYIYIYVLTPLKPTVFDFLLCFPMIFVGFCLQK